MSNYKLVKVKRVVTWSFNEETKFYCFSTVEHGGAFIESQDFEKGKELMNHALGFSSAIGNLQTFHGNAKLNRIPSPKRSFSKMPIEYHQLVF